MSEETLQIAEQRREAKSKGERERYTQLNAEFQKIARRDKKPFLSEQCKEIEEKQQNGIDERFLQENWRYRGTFHARIGMIKDRKSKALTEAERLRRGVKNTQNYIKNVFLTQITTMVWSLT